MPGCEAAAVSLGRAGEAVAQCVTEALGLCARVAEAEAEAHWDSTGSLLPEELGLPDTDSVPSCVGALLPLPPPPPLLPEGCTAEGVAVRLATLGVLEAATGVAVAGAVAGAVGVGRAGVAVGRGDGVACPPDCVAAELAERSALPAPELLAAEEAEASPSREAVGAALLAEAAAEAEGLLLPPPEALAALWLGVPLRLVSAEAAPENEAQALALAAALAVGQAAEEGVPAACVPVPQLLPVAPPDQLASCAVGEAEAAAVPVGEGLPVGVGAAPVGVARGLALPPPPTLAVGRAEPVGAWGVPVNIGL